VADFFDAAAFFVDLPFLAARLAFFGDFALAGAAAATAAGFFGDVGAADFLGDLGFAAADFLGFDAGLVFAGDAGATAGVAAAFLATWDAAGFFVARDLVDEAFFALAGDPAALGLAENLKNDHLTDESMLDLCFNMTKREDQYQNQAN